MERGIRRFPVEKLLSDSNLADADAQALFGAIVRAFAAVGNVQDYDGLVRQARLLVVAVEQREKRMAKATLPETAENRRSA